MSEVVDVAIKFSAQWSNKVYVRVRERKGEQERLMILPEELKIQDMAVCREMLSRVNVTLRVRVYVKKILGRKIHSLRYARVNHMVRSKVIYRIFYRLMDVLHNVCCLLKILL